MGEMVIAMVCMLIEPLSVMLFTVLLWKMPPSFLRTFSHGQSQPWRFYRCSQLSEILSKRNTN